METAPFWTIDFPRPADLPAGEPLPERVDVAVIGSGYTGLNAARVLARGGARVAVLERETIGWGASSRNGGMTTPGLKQDMRVVMERYGRRRARALWQATLDAISLIDQIVAEESIECCWRMDGYLALASKPSHFEKMKRKKSWFAEELDYTDLRLVERDELAAEIGTDYYHGGLAGEFGGGIHPARYVFGLARAAKRHRAQLFERSGVQHIEKTAGEFRLHTARGSLSAAEVVVTTNGYTDMLIPGLKPRVFPVGSYIIVTEPLDPNLQYKLSPKGRMFYDSNYLLNYFRLTPDGRMLWGGRNNLSTDLDLRQSASILRAQLVRTFPELAQAAITHTWNGRLGLTFDLVPHIGRIDGVHYALGYGGHGLSMATYLGVEVARLVNGEISSSPFAEIPHQTKFFYRSKPWFLPLAARYYRFLDWAS